MRNTNPITVNPICLRYSEALFKRTASSLNLLQAFWRRDETFRSEEYENLQRTLDSWYFGFGSPAVPGLLENVADDTGGTTLDNSLHPLIWEQIADLIRISHTAPLEDIRSTARAILIDLKMRKGFSIPRAHLQSPSVLLSMDELPHMNYVKEEHGSPECDTLYTTYTLFREYWFRWGRLENHIFLMGFHPEYMESYMKTHAHLFHADLPIPYADRYYLALLAAAQQRCIYLVLLFARQFLATGGDCSWLQGIHYGPIKWRQLSTLNRDLASRPWKITAEQIYSLTHGSTDSNNSNEILSLSELMHAVAIFTHVHALACFVFSCGVCPEIDQLFPECDQPNHIAGQFSNNNLDQLHLCCEQRRQASLANLSEQVESPPPDTPVKPSPTKPDHTLATQLLEVLKREKLNCDSDESEDIATEQFNNITRYNAELDIHHSHTTRTRSTELMTALDNHPLIARFLERPDSGYDHFEGEPFHEVEYCWDEEGFMLADRLCTGLGSLLNETFRNTYDLTYNTLSSIPDVDTTLYRRAVWCNVHSLFGVFHDDFRYECMERLLRVEQRAYLKLCATNPVGVNPQEHRFQLLFPELSPSEVIHIILVVKEARQQACLLYVLRAISDCQARVY